MSDVYFTKDASKLYSNLKSVLDEQFKAGDTIAIKLHMGEKGNKYYLKPPMIKPIVSGLLENGVNPFLFDSPTVYRIARHTVPAYIKTAAEHRYTKENMGCPIRVSNIAKSIESNTLKIGVCKNLIDADGVLVLSHVKSHMCAGFGAAIKNLGMGAVDKGTKNLIHNGGKPEYSGGCTLCEACQKLCPFKNISFEKGIPQFNASYCTGCSICIISCPHGAIKPRLDIFDNLLAEGAYIAYMSFKKSYFVNFIVDIADRCDCARGGTLIADDVGFLHSSNPVAIDKASLDLINEHEGANIFEKRTHKSPLLHIKHAEELGMGSLNYRLIRIS